MKPRMPFSPEATEKTERAAGLRWSANAPSSSYRIWLLFGSAVLLATAFLTGCSRAENLAPAPASPQNTVTYVDASALVLLPAGDFVMGDDDGDADEKPAHKVHVNAFFMDTREITQKAYEALMEKNPSKFKAPERPVDQVDWYHAVLYCNMRSR